MKARRPGIAGMLIAGLVLFGAMPAGLAEEIPGPDGPVVLTIAGDIGRGNRDPYRPAADVFLKFHEKEFSKAVEFDLAMLQALGASTRRLRMPGESRVRELEGTPLTALLDAVGADPKSITVTALDGFAVELGRREIDAHDWLVAYKEDGRYLGIGQRGPLWIVFTPAAPDGRATEEEEGRWPWASFYISVEGRTSR